MRRFLPVALATSLLSLMTLPALAATLQAGENLTVSGAIRDNAYLAGGNVTLDQPVNGDLLVAGGTVTVNAAVKQDILMGGGNLYIENTVGGDLRVAGGQIRIRSAVNGDLVVVGGTIDIRDGTVVQGDLIVAGGDVRIAGTVNGTIYARGGTVTFSGIAKGKADLRAGETTVNGTVDGPAVLVGKKISLGSQARLMRGVRYWLPKTESPLAGPQIQGEIVFDPSLTNARMEQVEKAGTAGFLAALAGISIVLVLSAALIILLLLLLTKTYFPDSARALLKHPWMSLLYGFLYFAATPIAALLFLITVIGAPVGLLLLMIYLFAFIFAKPLTALVLAELIAVRYKKSWGKLTLLLLAVICYLALKIVGFIPVIGWIAVTATVFCAFGALITTKWAKFAKVR
ncbi:MAG: polymer-forming cytoskeletal protein [Candidatus Peribacteraceae bacterium]|nr:polymer-forming cytoskeletal protein [Candidatus Peribacteraceae bacterium]